MISVIVVTKDDPALGTTLEALMPQVALNAAEVVVVDASSNRARGLREKYEGVRWIDFKPSNDTTIPQQRNVGIRNARGDILIFLDSDCTPGDEWLAAVTRPLVSGEERAVAGTIASPDYRTVRQPKSQYVTKWGNGNLGFHREVIDEIGMYDETLKVAEDYDLCIRMRAAGYRIRFLPEAAVAHASSSLADNLKKAFRYGRGATRLYLKHPREIFAADSIALFSVGYALFVAGLPLTLRVPWFPLMGLLPGVLARRPFSLRKETINLAHGAGVLVEFLSRPLLVVLGEHASRDLATRAATSEPGRASKSPDGPESERSCE